jgi:single-strand DNA-binding protein
LKEEKISKPVDATNEVYYKETGEKVEKTEWHRVTTWGKQPKSLKNM